MNATQKAREAVPFADALARQLLVTSGPHAAPVRLEAMEKVFSAWPVLCRLMSDLEVLAPDSAAAGLARARELRERMDQS
jgi:hypothetical protein